MKGQSANAEPEVCPIAAGVRGDSGAVSSGCVKTQRRGKPRLLLLSPTTRADLEEPLRLFKEFDVWHLYGVRISDTAGAGGAVHSLRFRGPIDALVKTLKIRPAVIQGSEPYYVPTGLLLSVVTLLAASLLRIPYYFPMFENIAPEVKFREVRVVVAVGKLVVRLLKWFCRLYARRAGWIFVLNNGAARNLLDLGIPEEKMLRRLYATWGVDLRCFTPERDGTEPFLGKDAILFIGRIVSEKGIRVLLEAFLEVRRHLPGASLLFIGDGPDARFVRDFVAAHSLNSAVSLLGVVPNSQLPRYIRAARVGAAPSITTRRWMEQVGMVNIQCIACGTPVVTTNSGAIPEFIENNVTGLVVPENDAQSLANALIAVLTDADLHDRLARQGRAAALRRYDIEANIRDIERTLLRLLGRHPSPSS